MFDLSALFKRAGKVAADNSPAILTAIGVTGTLTTAVLAAKGAFKAAEVILDAEQEREKEYAEKGEPHVPAFTFKEKADLTWKCFVPAAVSLVATATAIICSNRISDRRAAAMASAYSVVEKSYTEYRAKNIKQNGKKKDEDIRSEMSEDRLNKQQASRATIVLTDKGDTLCFDMWTERQFTSNKNAIDAAVNEFNKTVQHQGYAPLSEFYSLLGLSAPAHTHDIGYDGDRLMEIEYDGHILDNGTPALAFDFRVKPRPGFANFH